MLKRIPYWGSWIDSTRPAVSASSATESESMPHMDMIFPCPLCRLGIAVLSPELAVSVSAKVPPVVFAFEAELRTTARGI